MISLRTHKRPEGRFKKLQIMNALQKTQVFFKEVYVELRKVNWLKRREVIRYTLIVLGATLAVAAVLGGLDYLFSSAIQKFIIK